MFTWDWVYKHTVFYSQGFTGRQASQEDRLHRKTGSTGNRQHREQAAQGTGSTGNRQHRKTGFTGRQAAPPELCAQFVHMAHSFTTRAYCTICSQWHAVHSLRASCLP